MTQQLIIQTSDRDSLRSLLESALDREKRLLQGSISRLKCVDLCQKPSMHDRKINEFLARRTHPAGGFG